MELSVVYSNIIEDLRAGKRALIKLSPEQKLGLTRLWKAGLNRDDLHKVLCILDHSVDCCLDFSPFLCSELKKEIDSETLIFLLGAAQKHVIEAAAKDGFPPSGEFMSAVKNLLNSPHVKDPETFEWLLRTIEQTGMKSIFFKNDILKNKPGLGSLINSHKKASKEIIELLERRWAPLKGGPLG